ncbi:sigma-70 family RNA polymerase sigma factor [Curtobacterium flaccumfaciens pv. oortii]|uniref:RNA polymerase sigma factor n=1 Tax=Curtobacterium flaccumfaciens TaxID=2035 RepID=UPI001BDE39A1|nr:sigma-70 family RNA polymerase sigma factor [Curtobacterium flaccumfaciens]MBT1623044.1 sigma-70 family RNA polymerase sigma factor [Curtobacterium flaccumfaciens pv. oortii]
MTDDDVSLVRRVVSGDEAALATAFDRFAPALTRYAWAVSATPDDVEHAVQDSFLSLWSRAAGLELPTGSLLPWLLAECRSHANTRGADVTGGDPLRWLQQDVLALAEVDRRLVALCLVTGRTWSEAVEQLGLRPAGNRSPRGSRATKEVQR